jgi:hypothetical protein
MTTGELSTLGYAHMYIARGWPLIVCRPRTKKATLTPNGVLDATTDPEVIARWRRLHPNANWAVATGAPGPMALDIDDLDAAPASVLKAAAGAPRTRSARGGCAFFEGTDAHTSVLWNGRQRYGELRGQGSYQMLPPSIHPTGVRYTWLQEPRGKLPVLPDFVAGGKRTLGAGIAPKVESIPPGGGMAEYLTDLAVRLVRAGERDPDVVTTVLLAVFEAKRSAPASAYGGSERDTRRIAKWAIDSEIATRERRSRALVLGDAGLKERS